MTATSSTSNVPVIISTQAVYSTPPAASNHHDHGAFDRHKQMTQHDRPPTHGTSMICRSAIRFFFFMSCGADMRNFEELHSSAQNAAENFNLSRHIFLKDNAYAIKSYPLQVILQPMLYATNFYYRRCIFPSVAIRQLQLLVTCLPSSLPGPWLARQGPGENSLRCTRRIYTSSSSSPSSSSSSDTWIVPDADLIFIGISLTRDFRCLSSRL